ANHGMDLHATPAQFVVSTLAEQVVAKGREEQRLGAPAGELYRCHGAAACGDLEERGAVDDVAGGRYAVDAQELDPLEVTEDGDTHGEPIARSESQTRQRRLARCVGFVLLWFCSRAATTRRPSRWSRGGSPHRSIRIRPASRSSSMATRCGPRARAA